ncbi:TM2 domain-containing protein [Pseudohongiella sp.]|uniref:TM2 domain-containing protein n=1 Tax=marine sediment metagenome TaxID=412755 RepID=A0A0F9W5Q3_9ZZZZ|nr:TM2 domain-containing protein [Pseudohongiella sp.]HDZ09686.1 TM2 domain-containing protein [Pseudohongiella sp.]HEA61875.1 TM2 domain-containing protein [Pseudohongiella sp.]
MFSEKELNLEEHELREQIRSLPDHQRQYYLTLESARLKSPDRYLLLNRLFPLGLHHFYLARWGRGIVNGGLTATGLTLLLGTDQVVYGLMLLTAMVFIEIPQLLNARHLVHSRNNRIMARCLARAQKHQSNEDPR